MKINIGQQQDKMVLTQDVVALYTGYGSNQHAHDVIGRLEQPNDFYVRKIGHEFYVLPYGIVAIEM